MKLAFFSPLSPQKSGIADYSEELLPYLAQGAEIDLFVEGFEPTNPAIAGRFRVFDYVADPDCLARLDAEYDAVLYHMGNDHRYHTGIYETALKYPGIVVFHDFALQDFFLGMARARGRMSVYLEEVEACYGAGVRAEMQETLARGGVPSQVSMPLAFPLNQRLARSAGAIIVHSAWSRERLQRIAPAVPIARINHHITAHAAAAHSNGNSDAPHAHEAANGDERRGGQRDDSASHAAARDERRGGAEVRICSFGLITPDKGIERALRALSALKREGHAFRYTLVGAPNSFFDVRALVRRYDLSDRVTITDHVSLEEFERRIAETDIAINLRERTVGETSGSLCRIMAAGVAAVVSGVGWFAELPNDAVVKIDMDECADALLCAYLRRLIEDAPLRARIGANARRYVLGAHRIERSAADYLRFIGEVVAARTRRELVGQLSQQLSLLGIDGDEDEALVLRGVAAEVAALAPAQAFTPPPVAAHSVAAQAVSERAAATPEPSTVNASHASNGRLRKVEGIDYKRAAIEYPRKLDAERHRYLYTKPFYNLANKPPKHTGDGMDVETHRHFCDFANMAVALALPPGSRLLDVGCGSGWLTEYFARLGYDVTGTDISPDLIEIARERVERVPFDVDHETPLRCRFVAHDIESAPLAETFDAVVCYDSLHHFVDEHAVMRHLSAMVRYGGVLFILEGDKPDEGSATEEELVDVMLQYETLESPFSRTYLRRLLDEHGFAVVGDFVSVNGLYERDTLEGGRLPVEPPEVNYLLCKKVVREDVEASASSVPQSFEPGSLSARLEVVEELPATFAPGATLQATLRVENTGNTLWLTGAASRRGAVMLGLRLFDETGVLVSERHGEPPLPRAVAPGERVSLPLEVPLPDAAGSYRLKIDLVAQHVCWFEQQGSAPLVLEFAVRSGV